MLMEKFSRRDFLKTSGALVVVFSATGPLADAAGKTAAARPLATDQVDGFIAIDGNGNLTVYSGKVDLGTGVQTALTQMAAEELCVPLEKVTLIQGDTALTPDQGITWGSLTIQAGGMQIRQACATAREALVERAGAKLKVPSKDLYAKDGRVMVLGSEKGISYAELIGGKQFEMKVDAKAPTKSPTSYTIVGQSVPRFDIPDKVTGRFTYMHDFKLKGMLHARVVHPAAMKATLQSVDDSAAKQVPGYVATVRKGNFVAVVARSEWGAIKAAEALKTGWSEWRGLPDKATLWDYVRKSKVAKEEELQKAGNSAEAMKSAARRLTATYDFAVHTHGSIGPSCAVAEFKDGKLTSWSASQATHDLRKQLALMLGLSPENVRCIYVEGAGCYGRNGHEDAAADAALLAKAVGNPVRVQWSRADEHGWDPKGPPTLVDLQASTDNAGNVTAWDSVFYIPQAGPELNVGLVAADLAGMPTAKVSFPGNIFQLSAIPYKFPNVRTVCRRLETTPLRPSWIRTPGRMQNTYANECFIDELAAAAGVDPVEFRLKYLDPADKRGIEVLNRVAALAKWEKRPSPIKSAGGNIVKGRGVSYTKYELVRTYVGAIAEVEVDRTTGRITVPKFYITHDCGQIINPDGLKNQIEGNVIQTVSRTLVEEVKFDRSQVTSLDWVSYPILKFPEVPEIVIELIDRPTEKPWGAGEPAAAIIPSAISNAVFDATGVRLRSIPYTPAKVLAAMQAT